MAAPAAAGQQAWAKMAASAAAGLLTGGGGAATAAEAGGQEAAGDAREEVDRAEDVRTILRRKEEEVKEMLAPEKSMYGELHTLIYLSRYVHIHHPQSF